MVLLVEGFGSHKFARAKQQGNDASSVCCHVQPQESVGAVVSEAFGLVEGEAEPTVKRAGKLHYQRFSQIPEQLVKLPHDREHLEHLYCGSRGPPPVLPAEGALGYLLPRAEAVVGRATTKALLPEVVCGHRLSDESSVPVW